MEGRLSTMSWIAADEVALPLLLDLDRPAQSHCIQSDCIQKDVEKGFEAGVAVSFRGWF
jgi:hypothetical protein